MLSQLTKYEDRALRSARLLGRRLQAYAIVQFGKGNVPRPSAQFLVKQLPLLTDLMVVANLRGRLDARKAAFQAEPGYALALATPSDGPIFNKTIEIMRKALGPSANLKALEQQYNIVALRTLSNVSDTIEKDIRATAYGLIERGATVKEAKDVLGKRFDALGLTPRNSFQLETIFRTASSVAYGAGSWAAYQDPDIQEILWGYTYSAVMDDRTRENHAAAEGTTLPKDDEFWQRMWPPNGYNCILPGQKVQGRFNLGFKSWYDGEAVEIQTASGKRLSVTPNHPIFTQRGKVSADLLREGDYVLSYKGEIGDDSLASNVNEQNPPALIENVFAAIKMAGGSLRSTVASTDFHGDAASFVGDIEIVATERELLLNIEASSAERSRQLVFATAYPPTFPSSFGDQFAFAGSASSSSNLSRFGLAADSFGISSRASRSPFNFFRAGAAAQRHAGIAENLVDCATVNAVSNRKGLRSFARKVAARNFSLGSGVGNTVASGRFKSVPKFVRFGSGANLDASIYDPSFDGFGSNSVVFAKRLQASSSQVFLDKIVKIVRRKFVGHVYDLQSEGGWIIAEGVFQGNCRCEVIPLFSRERINRPPPEAVADPGFGYNPGAILSGLADTTGLTDAPAPKPLPLPAPEPPAPAPAPVAAPEPIDIVSPAPEPPAAPEAPGPNARITLTADELKASKFGEGDFTVPTEGQQLTWLVGEKWNPVTRQYENANPVDIAAQVAPYVQKLSAQTGLDIQPEVVINTPPATLQEWSKAASAMVAKFPKILENVQLFNVNRSDPDFRGRLEREIPRGRAYRYQKRVEMLSKRAEDLRNEMIEDLKTQWSAKIDDPEKNGAQATMIHELGHQVGYELEREDGQDYNTWAMDWARAEQATEYVSANFSRYAGGRLALKGLQSFRAELTAESFVEIMLLDSSKWSRITRELVKMLERRGYAI